MSYVVWGAPPPVAEGAHDLLLQISRVDEEPPAFEEPIEPSFEVDTPSSNPEELADLIPVEVISDPLPFPDEPTLDAVDLTLDFPGRTVFQRPLAEPTIEPEPEQALVLQPASPEIPEPAAAATPLSVDVPPELQREGSPAIVYPNLAQRRGQEGTVVCRLTIDREGRVTQALLETSSGYDLLDETALAGVLLWRYRPGTRDGHDVEMDVLQRIHFRK